MSKSTVSSVCQAIREQLAAWSQRRLDDLDLDYLFLDASMFKMHAGSRGEPVLAAWGITTDGKPVFVGLEPGGAESTDAWSGFLDGLTKRGLRDPVLVISDGAAGLINAIEAVFARSLRQRCLIHRCRNVLAKVPVAAQQEIKDAFWAIFDTEELLAAGIARAETGWRRAESHRRLRPDLPVSVPVGGQVSALGPRATNQLSAFARRAP